MKQIRPRLSPEEYEALRITKDKHPKYKRIMILSDMHMPFVDQDAVNCVISVLEDNYFDEIIFNGDIFDFPFISRHARRLYPVTNMTEVEEVEQFKYITSVIKKATSSSLVFREGNHEERVTKPYSSTKEQLERISTLYNYFNTTSLQDMLSNSIDEYDPSPERNYYNMFSVVHGVSLAQNAPKKNLYTYMSSGCSGHTHRLNSVYISNKRDNYVWLESGHLRNQTEVEYLPTANVANWQQGFVTVTFYLGEDEPRFFAQAHPIIENSVLYNGILYRG